jgi:glycosyltransferase involved in cell wall biosynthesis
VVSISNDQRSPLPQANWVATIHHGLPPDALEPRFEPGGYLAFLGRISPEKRADRAVEIARRTGLELRIAAKVDDADREYYEREIEPMLGAAHVEFIGEIGPSEKADFLGHASALLFPIDWAEPFGLVMIESMACATPVVAFRSGSVPEVITDGVSGFVVDDMDAAVDAVQRLGEIDRRTCRQAFDDRFTVERMARDYLALFEHLVAVGEGSDRTALPVMADRASV